MDPPARAAVSSINEKRQVQAPGRKQKGLSMKPGRPATMTRDYNRNGTTTLFVALNILDGTVIGRHADRHQKFIAFFDQTERVVPAGREIHAVVDNCSAHKHKAVAEWLKGHSCWTLHFAPTSSSEMNAVESFFGKLVRRWLRRL